MALLQSAVTALRAVGFTVAKQSSWWRSTAWPDPSDPPYLNGVLIAGTDAGPAEALERLLAVEDLFGRRRAARNAPRTLDLDLIAHGRTISDHPALPHPRAHKRLFVMGPLAQVAPDWVHPVLGRTAAELADLATTGRDAAPV